MGVNSREQLAAAEAVFQRRARARAMRQGATLIAPDTVWFSFDTAIGRDVTIEPNVFFGPGVVVEDGAAHPGQLPHGRRAHRQGRPRRPVRALPSRRRHRRRRARRQLRRGQERQARGRRQGQPSRLHRRRPRRAKAPTSAPAPSSATTTASTSTSPTSARAPSSAPTRRSWRRVKIGDGAYVGSGSVITKDVEPDALALERSAQEERPGWAAKFRAHDGKATQESRRLAD